MLLLLVASPFLAWWLIGRVRRSIQKPLQKNMATGVIIVAVVAYAGADDFFGQYQFNKLCKTEAGLKIVQRAEGVEGFVGGQHGYEYLKLGYKFIEYEKAPKQVIRYSLGEDGKWKQEVVPAIQSKYRIKLERLTFPNHMGGTRWLIEEIASGTVLATNNYLYYEGGWVQRAVAPIGGGTGYYCPSTGPVDNRTYISKVLIPFRAN